MNPSGPPGHGQWQGCAGQSLERLRIYLLREMLWLGFHNPAMMRLPERRARRFLEAQVRDPELRAKLLPAYWFGCKRVLISDDYLRSVGQPNLALVSDAIG